MICFIARSLWALLRWVGRWLSPLIAHAARLIFGAWVIDRWWAWRNRCKDARVSSAYFPTAGMAQRYLTYLHYRYRPCKVCGGRTCRWAQEIPDEKINKAAFDAECRELFRRLGV